MQASRLTRLRQAVTLTALGVALAHLLFPDLAIDHITLVLLAFALVPWLTPLVKSFEAPGGWKIELRDEVKRELDIVATGTLQRLATLDVQLIEYWEKKKFLQADEAAERLTLIDETARSLEAEFEAAGQLERLGIGLALRAVYWEYLTRAREHYGSGKEYHGAKARVLAGLNMLEKNKARPPDASAA